jgi:predicted MFS family arabinose efflux permease
VACGLFWAGPPLGRVLGNFLVGTLAPDYGWRACFYAVGAAGLPCAAAVLFFTDRRERPAGPAERGPSGMERGRILFTISALRWVVAGNVLAAVAAGASQLEVAWLVAERGFSLTQGALASGTVAAAASLLGSPLAGALADRWERAAPGGRLRALATIIGLTLPLAAVFYRAVPGSVLFYGCWFAAQLGVCCWPGISSAVIQELAPAQARAMAVASAMVAVNLLGLGPGAWLAGAAGDARGLTAGLLAAAAIGMTAVVPYAMAARRYAGDRARTQTFR